MQPRRGPDAYPPSAVRERSKSYAYTHATYTVVGGGGVASRFTATTQTKDLRGMCPPPSMLRKRVEPSARILARSISCVRQHILLALDVFLIRLGLISSLHTTFLFYPPRPHVGGGSCHLRSTRVYDTLPGSLPSPALVAWFPAQASTNFRLAVARFADACACRPQQLSREKGEGQARYRLS